MTKREYYDLLIRSCDDGTFPSYDAASGACVYRGPKGMKCAVGVLLPDEIAAVANHATVYQLDEMLKVAGKPFDFANLVEGLTINDLRNVQNAHDLAASSAHRNGTNFKRDFIERLHKLPFFREYAP